MVSVRRRQRSPRTSLTLFEILAGRAPELGTRTAGALSPQFYDGRVSRRTDDRIDRPPRCLAHAEHRCASPVTVTSRPQLHQVPRFHVSPPPPPHRHSTLLPPPHIHHALVTTAPAPPPP